MKARWRAAVSGSCCADGCTSVVDIVADGANKPTSLRTPVLGRAPLIGADRVRAPLKRTLRMAHGAASRSRWRQMHARHGWIRPHGERSVADRRTARARTRHANSPRNARGFAASMTSLSKCVRICENFSTMQFASNFSAKIAEHPASNLLQASCHASELAFKPLLACLQPRRKRRKGYRAESCSFLSGWRSG